MKHVLIGLGAVVIFIVIVIAVAVGGVNKGYGLDEDVKKAWAEVENQLKRRFDLIPNLVESVKGVASHEKEVFTALAEARKGYAGAGNRGEKIQAAQRYESAIGRLLVIVENYPNLKANQSFEGLMFELAGTENRIAVARRRYNETVELLNVYCRKFPSRFFASIAGVEKVEYFEVAEEEKATPKVDFTEQDD